MSKKSKPISPRDRFILESLRDIHGSLAMLAIGGLEDEDKVEIAAKNLYRLQEVCTLLGEPIPAEIAELMSAIVNRSKSNHPLGQLRKLSEAVKNYDAKKEPGN